MASGERVIRSACRSCQGVCQGLVHIDDNGRIVQITGDKESPTSQGFICSKGVSAAEQLYHPDHITRPQLRTKNRGQGDRASETGTHHRTGDQAGFC
ncbi:MAG: hypothetical protein ACOX4Z_01935 [Desulfobulbus sp.]